MNDSMMQFEGVAALFGVIAIITLFIGYKLLATSSWVGGWIRGNVGIGFTLLTGVLILCVIDLRSYKPMFDDKPVATLNLREISPQHFEVRLVDALGVENRYSITGKEWYITANQFRWSKRLSLGLGHGYRFNVIMGVNDVASQSGSQDIMAFSRHLDVWKFIHNYLPNNIFVSTEIITTPAQPLVDAAMYEIVPLGFDFIVRPLNELAKRAQPVVNQPVNEADTAVPAPATEQTGQDAVKPAETTAPVESASGAGQ